MLRIVAFACALLELGVPGSVALADALEDGAPAGQAIPHFESRSTETCPHAHGLDAFCQFLNAAWDVAAPVVPRLREGRALAQPLAAVAVPGRSVRTTHPQSRAPPSLS